MNKITTSNSNPKKSHVIIKLLLKILIEVMILGLLYWKAFGFIEKCYSTSSNDPQQVFDAGMHFLGVISLLVAAVVQGTSLYNKRAWRLFLGGALMCLFVTAVWLDTFIMVFVAIISKPEKPGTDVPPLIILLYYLVIRLFILFAAGFIRLSDPSWVPFSNGLGLPQSKGADFD